MNNLFNKPQGSISVNDVNELIVSNIPESDTIEYKKELPAESNQQGLGNVEWAKQGKISDYAKKKLMKEVVAFANAYGGITIIGIEETQDEPKRAKSIQPLARCHDLAKKLSDVLSSCIDPQFLQVEAFGIPINSTAEDGVVVIRVAESPIAPHRVNLKNETNAYIRRRDRSDKMMMREIQDMTINKLLKQNFIEDTLHRRQAKFIDEWSNVGKESRAEGMRISFIPTISRIAYIPKVHEKFNLFRFNPITLRTSPEFSKSDFLNHCELTPKTILRGVTFSGVGTHHSVKAEIGTDGLIELVYFERPYPEDAPACLHLGELLALAANGMLLVDQFRLEAGVPNLEYAMEIEIHNTSNQFKLLDFGDRGTLWGNVEASHLELPRFSIGHSKEFNSILNDVYHDLFNAAGIPNPVEVTWER